MLKVAVIGLGDIFKIHQQAIKKNPNAKLTAVCDVDESLRNTVTDVHFYTDYQVMLEKEALDCVHICLPHYLHYPVTKACVEKGVHVFLEKPLALYPEEGLALARLVEDNKDVKVCVCFQNRFNETFEKLQDIAKSGEYGQIIGIKGLVTWFRPNDYYEAKPWRGQMKYAGGGVMMNQSIHTLDLMQLLGGEIKAIKGSIINLLNYDIDVEDTASARIQFENGATGLFFATVANCGNSSVELQVLFENGKFTIKDNILTRLNETGKKEEIIEDEKLHGAKFYYGSSHAKLINQFYSCIIHNDYNYVHVRDALTSLQMIDAICQSSKQQKEIEMEKLQYAKR